MLENSQYNCFSFAINKMGWAKNGEPKDLEIHGKFKVGDRVYNLRKFLVLYAEHIGEASVPSSEFGKRANIITVTSRDELSHGYVHCTLRHIAVIDQKNPLKVWQRRGFYRPVENVSIEECGHLGKGCFIDYWKVPETENFKGFVW